MKQTELTIRSSAAEYLTYVATVGEQQNSIEMRYEDENIWLTQKMMATLYDVDVRTINYHIKKIFSDSELQEKAVIQKFRITATDGKSYNTNHYSLEMIIAVGFKVNSERAVQFRKWVNRIAKDYTIKGWVIDDERYHETRDAEDADLDRYSRDSLIRIGDSDQAEAVRRKLDTHTTKELRKLKKQRGTKNDEITGEPLCKNAAFHHLNAKELYTDPVDVLDENKGINVNNDTHKEIHKQNIRTADELKKNSASIKETVDLLSQMAPIFKFIARGL